MDFSAMKRRDLLELCRQYGLATRGSKADLAVSLAGALLLKQQDIQLSSSSSCSSSLHLRKNRVVMAGSSSSHRHLRKSKAVNNGIHRWTKSEEHSLIETVNVLSPKFGGFSGEFCDAVADEMKKIWGSYIKFVSLDGEKVRYKMKALKKDFEEAQQQGAGQQHVYAMLTPQFSCSVSSQLALQSQSTSSFSVDGVEGPYSKSAALKELIANECPYLDLYKYAGVLADATALELFWAKDTYEEKTALLDYIYNEHHAPHLQGSRLLVGAPHLQEAEVMV